MKPVTPHLLLLVLCVAVPLAHAQQKGSIELSCKAEVEVIETDAEGNRLLKTVPAVKVLPGDIVLYRLTYRHVGDKPAANVTINNPIPEHMTYVDGSAVGKGTNITFSIDGGETYATPDLLTLEDAEGTERKARAEEYTHIRWQLKEDLNLEETGEVTFRAKLK